MESDRQSEIPRLKQIPRDVREDTSVLNTDARRSKLKGDGEKSKDTEKEESGRCQPTSESWKSKSGGP